jgi:DNA invertase Pin-like site-specific DNA recombinase
MIKAWAFYRRSTDKQELSIEDQRRECSAFATAQGWQIVQEFTPAKGYASGLTIDRDPEFQRMLRLAEVGDHGAAFLLVYDVSRFGRLNPEEKIYWEQRFKKDGGLKVVYVKDGFRNDDSLGDGLARYVKHSEAHQYSVTLSQSTLRGSKSHAQLGHSAGGRAPYGYDRLLIDANRNPVGVLAKGHHKADKLQRVVWTPSKERAPVIREIFARADQGEGLHAIVSWLNGQKLASPAGKYWTKSQVHYLLRNRAYIGERLYNRRSYKSYRRGERSRMQNTPDQWIVTPGAHEAIVDKQVFDRVQANFQKRAFGQGRSYTFAHVLSGLIVCAKCGNKFNGYTKEGNRGHRYRYYSCAGYNRGGASIC